MNACGVSGYIHIEMVKNTQLSSNLKFSKMQPLPPYRRTKYNNNDNIQFG